jgi:hypothetical protein
VACVAAPGMSPVVAPNYLWFATINRFRSSADAYLPRGESSDSKINEELLEDKLGDEQAEGKVKGEQEEEPERQQPEKEQEDEQPEGQPEDKQNKENPEDEQLDEKLEDEQKKHNRKKKACIRQPQIRNRDKRAMKDCIGKKVGQTCAVRCDANYLPSKGEVKCVDGADMQGNGKWNLDGASCEAEVVCRDNNNNPVDFFILYKLAKNAPVKDGQMKRNGQNFLFMSEGAENVTGDGNDSSDSYWKHTGWEPLENTLAPIRRQEQMEEARRQNRNTNGNLVYAMYSNRPPGAKEHSGFAHAKGDF